MIRTWAAAMGTRERLGALVVALAIGMSCIPASAGPVEAEAGAVQAYFFGDSLMGGSGATPRRPVMARMAAAQLGWDVEVDELAGTGYTTSGARPSYIDRLREAGAMSGRYDVVLLEGGTNDARSAGDPERVRQAVEEVVAEVRRRQPQAQIVLMGAYDPPAGGAVRPGRALVDDVIEAVAQDEGLPFFSPLSGGWTEQQPPSFLHPDGLHPSDEGYSVMGERLTQELAALELRAVRERAVPERAVQERAAEGPAPAPPQVRLVDMAVPVALTLLANVDPDRLELPTFAL